MYLIIDILGIVITVYFWILMARVALSLLIGFNVINPYNPAVRTVNGICWDLTEPLLKPIRRFLPDLGGLDISPIVLYLIIRVLYVLLVRGVSGGL